MNSKALVEENAESRVLWAFKCGIIGAFKTFEDNAAGSSAEFVDFFSGFILYHTETLKSH